MEQHIVRIQAIQKVTHNVKSYRFSKPTGYKFEPGQATEVSINKPGWENERRPFTFTSLNENDYLEFTIKSYHDHDGVTHQLDSLQPGDELIIRDVWGAIAYKGEGYFIAGGAGITPFVAIMRQLKKDNKVGDNYLFFSNKTSADIILKDELSATFKPGHIQYLITGEAAPGYLPGRINKEFLRRNVTDFSKPFYVCGPDKMIAEINKTLEELGAKAEMLVFER
jgi:ferredoxin-NADP reductase